MRRYFAVMSFTASALFITAVLAPPSAAQSQLPRPGQLPPPGGAQQRPPQSQPLQPPQQPQPLQPPQQPQPGPTASPARPYKPVMISAPPPVNDPSFASFRQQVTDVAKRKDRAALARLVVAQGFFWEGERGDKADQRKSGVDNLAGAIGLNNPDGSGWEVLAGYVSDSTGTPLPQRKEVICSPAEPVFDEKQFEEMIKATNTEEADWGYPMQPGVEVRATAQPNSAVIEKLGMHFIRVMQDDSAAQQQVPVLRIVTPNGKAGYMKAELLNPLGNDQICYVKEAGGWKIAGFIGGEQ